ncbi:hypothetical protein CCP3SC15_60043 [Gammaproteobacteria bacterium]
MLIERVSCTLEQPIAASDLAQLKKLALRLMHTLNPNRSAEALTQEIAKLIAAYNTRSAQQVADKAAQSAAESMQRFPVKRT